MFINPLPLPPLISMSGGTLDAVNSPPRPFLSPASDLSPGDLQRPTESRAAIRIAGKGMSLNGKSWRLYEIAGGEQHRANGAPSHSFPRQRPENIRAGCANANKPGVFSSVAPGSRGRGCLRPSAVPHSFLQINNLAHRINSTSFQSRKQERNGEHIQDAGKKIHDSPR
jgi:hypothetical protein